MRRLILLGAALALALAACGSGAGESTPPAQTGTPAPSPAESVSPVYTDWSKLEPYQPDTGRFTRYYDAPVDRLLAVEGGYGGALIPFCGRFFSAGNGWGGMKKYGLARLDGMVVCDPVYTSVSVEDGFLLLKNAERIGDVWDTGTRTTVAAPDGSWVLPGEYRRVSFQPDGRLLLVDMDGGVWFCDRAGAVTPSPLNETLAGYPEITLTDSNYWSQFENGLLLFPRTVGQTDSWSRVVGSWLLDAVTGAVRYLPELVGCYGWHNGEPLAAAYTEERSGYLDRNGDWVIPPQFAWAGEFAGDCAIVELTDEGEYALIDRAGQVIFRAEGHLNSYTDRNGGVYYLDREWNEAGETVLAVCDGAGRPLPDHPLTGREATLDYYAATTREDLMRGNSRVEGGLMRVWDYDGTMLGAVEGAQNMSIWDLEDGKVVLYQYRAVNNSAGVYDLSAGAWTVPLGRYDSIGALTDGAETVYAAYASDGCDILRSDGTRIAHVDSVRELCGGALCVRDGGYSGFLDLEGSWLLRWPVEDNDD